MPPQTVNLPKSSQPQVTLYGANRINFLSSWLFLWIFGLLKVSRRHNLDSDNLSLQESERAGVVGDKLERAWNEEHDRKERSIRHALIKTFGFSYALLGLYKILWAASIFIGSYYLLNQLIIYIEERDDSDSDNDIPNSSGHLYAMGLFLTSVFSSIFYNQLISECTRIGVQVRAALMVLVYRKSLRLSYVRGNADIVNLISHDCNRKGFGIIGRVAEACVNFHFLWSSVVEIIAIIILAWIELGIAAVPALVILIILIPIQYKLGWLTSKFANSMAKITMSRINIMSEILTAIKLIKFYAWESYFRDRIAYERQKEMSQLLTGLVFKVWTLCVVFGTPILVMLACLIVKDLAYPDENGVKARTIFTTLALFNILRYPLIMLPIAVRSILGAQDSFNRLNEFLLQTELEPFKQGDDILDDDPKLRIVIDNADFLYDEQLDPSLRFLTMQVKQGEVVAIVGDVGAGKSSVLAAILGQIRLSAGTRRIRGSISYVPHDAWLLNATLKDNILFGNELDNRRYQEVLHVCGVNRDLPLLSHGDMTEIGERGVNLSLGQRQRVSLARAVYSDADIVLLDDPLSAMDPVVAKHVFHECIRKYLKNKAVVYVTNQLQFLSECDFIMVMKGGSCDEQGTYEELIAKDVNLASLIGEYMEIEDPDQIDELISEIRLDPVIDEQDNDELEAIVVGEHHDDDAFAGGRDEAKRASAARHNTIQFGSKRPTGFTDANEQTISRIIDLNAHTIQNSNINELTISKIIEHRNHTVLSGAGKTRMMGNKINREINATAKAIERNQLTIHSLNDRDGIAAMNSDSRSKKPNEGEVDLKVYLEYLKKYTGYWGSFMIIFFFFLVQDWWLIKTVDVTDKSYGYFLGVYGALVGIAGLGIFIRGLAFAWVVYHKSHSLHDRTFMKTLRAPMSYFDVTPIGRILSIFAKHQIFVDEVLTDNALQFLSFLPVVLGVVIFVVVLIPYTIVPAVFLALACWALIHFSYEVEERFKLLDAMTKSQIFAHLSATLDGLASIRVYNTQFRFDKQNLDKIDANNKTLFTMMQVKSWLALYIDILASLFIYSTALCVVTLKSIGASDTGLALTNALQLLIFGQWMIRYGRDVSATMSSVQQLLHFRQNIPVERPTIIEENRPPKEWGSRGEIEFKQVTLRYNAYGVAVLKHVTFHVKAREKIGIVGKTGSGKSTLLVSLLRIVELTEGQILIDDINISTIGLRDLRNKIAIIPQEPVIFAGTIKSNLDPFNTCTDEEIWQSLNAVHLTEKVKSLPDKLETPVLENGRNFSFGQRQLFCIARALLKKTNILVLDEATSAVDSQTDHLFQETIKKNFANHTVLTIAHRLNTIMEAERILCLNEGRVVEFDTPLRLLDNPDGFFYQLITGSGPEAAERLKQIALQHAKPISSSSSIIESEDNGGLPSAVIGGTLSDSRIDKASIHSGTINDNTSVKNSQNPTAPPPAHTNKTLPPSLDVFDPHS
ncbi:10995_t:CDS:10 [Ambispora gerdemannii]|uniref:10995_t:CDS:1 n=1 Tax=Ambispora gerdemannii TaxID=144530 RepID=A0A9N8VGH4_9GLOM|nr:10995_t:CDS:10 [Ambispora gerdemannii]